MFGILDTSTQLLFWILTTIAFVGTVWFWQKLAKKSLKQVIGRVFLLFLVQVLAITSIGLSVNKSNDFFATWGDLFGFKNNLAQVAIAPESLSSISRQELLKATVTKGGSLIIRKIITGDKSGVSDYVYLVVSPALSKHLKSGTSPSLGSNYQVVEFFSGYPGLPQTWLKAMNLANEIEKTELQGKIPPTLAIVPSINVVRGADTECLDIPGIAYVETWLTSDMKKFVQRYLGVDDRKWSAVGFSTGGWCAAMIGVRNQNQYKSSVSIAGYFEPSFSRGVNAAERISMRDKYNLAKITTSSLNNLKLMAIYSKVDKHSFGSMNRFLAAINTALDVKLVEMPNAGHNTKAWRPFISTALEWIASINSTSPQMVK